MTGGNRTILYSTHSVPEALELADRFLVVSEGELVDLESAREDGTGRPVVTEKAILKLMEQGE